MSLLRQDGGFSDGYVQREDRSVTFVLLRDEEHVERWLEGLLADGRQEEYETVLQKLGGRPRNEISMICNRILESINITVDFVTACATLYHCVVVDEFLQVHTPAEWEGFAEPGFDGYRWNTEHTDVVKGPPETEEEKRERLERARRERILGDAFLGTKWDLYTAADIEQEEYERILREVDAQLPSKQRPYAQMTR